jgi:hypothetical protein
MRQNGGQLQRWRQRRFIGLNSSENLDQGLQNLMFMAL